MHPVASATLIARLTISRFRTGSAPGYPRQTGQTAVFAGAPKTTGQAQNAFVRVFSCAWTSSPMTVSKPWEDIRTTSLAEAAPRAGEVPHGGGV